MKLQCVSCHKGAATEDLAAFPGIQQCRVCHTGMAERKIPSRRVYAVPEFVFFSHKTHAVAKMDCASCHGEVAQQEVVREEHAVKMKWCVDCHKSSKATIACNKCHEPGQ